MDIAEIRKKAKAQSQPQSGDAPQEFDLNEVSQEEILPELEEFDLGEGSLAPAAAENVNLSLNVETAPAPEVVSGLDRLFAATEEFALATSDSYADGLEDSAAISQLISQQYLAFHLGDEEYALDIKRISEIIKVREFTDIPRAPKFVLGIISLRGVVVPVFDLRNRLKLGVSEILPTSRIVVCQLDDVSVGLLVDTINQVVNLVDDEIEPPPGVLSGLDREMVGGIGRYQGRMIILLNIQSVLEVASVDA